MSPAWYSLKAPCLIDGTSLQTLGVSERVINLLCYGTLPYELSVSEKSEAVRFRLRSLRYYPFELCTIQISANFC